MGLGKSICVTGLLFGLFATACSSSSGGDAPAEEDTGGGDLDSALPGDDGGVDSTIVDGGPGPRNLFHAGALDVVELFVLALLVVVAARAAGRSSGLRARQA